MEIVVLLVIWGASIFISVKFAKKIGANTIVAGLASVVAPILAPITYAYIASNSKAGKVQKEEILQQILIVVGVVIILYVMTPSTFTPSTSKNSWGSCVLFPDAICDSPRSLPNNRASIACDWFLAISQRAKKKEKTIK